MLTAPLEDLDAARQAMLERLNELRVERKFPRLRENPVLHRVAQAHAEELLAQDPDGDAAPESALLANRLTIAAGPAPQACDIEEFS